MASVEPKKQRTKRNKDFVIGLTDDIKKHYKFGKKIGQPGQFGYAVRATHLASNEERAVKVVNKSRFRRALDRDFHFKQLRAEISVMKKMNHENIIKFYEVFEDVTHLFIVMELATGGELFDRIKETGQYSEKDAAGVLRQMFQGIAYMHEMKIAHCDLKPDNFLFANGSKDAKLKIIDFGMSKFVKRRKKFKSLCGTPYYVAPEVLRGKYNEHSDLWSLGVVMFVMLFGYPPFYAENAIHGAKTDEMIFRLVLKGFDPVTKKGYGAHFPKAIPCTDSAKDLISKLLTLDVAKRFTAEEALNHPWLLGKTATDTPVAPQVMDSLKKFQGTTVLKNHVLMLMADSLDESEIENLKKSFLAMDTNGDGVISVDELKAGLEKSGMKDANEKVGAILKAADVDGDGNISYEELLVTAVHRKLIAKEERLEATFKRLDLDGDGRVTLEELQTVLGQDSQVSLELLKEADVDGDGTIDYEEFLKVWQDAQL